MLTEDKIRAMARDNYMELEQLFISRNLKKVR